MVVITVHRHAEREVAADQVLRGLGEVLGEVELGELLLYYVVDAFAEAAKVGRGDESVAVSSLTFVDPNLHELVGFCCVVAVGKEETLEDVCYVAEIEFVVEVYGSFLKESGNCLVEEKRSADDS